MSIASALLPEFDHEMANTRTCLERVPDDKLEWSPHEKSWSLRELVTHIAHLVSWTTVTVVEPSFDMAPDGEMEREEPVDSVAAGIARFDENVATARDVIAGASDEVLLESWSLLNHGHLVFAMPRIAVLRSFLMNHIIHHRGQLTVYLRLNDVALPPLYGPTADERV